MSMYYVQVFEDELSNPEALWSVEYGKAHRIDVAPSELTVHHADAGENVLTTIQKRFPGTSFHKLSLGPGEYYPRMARPNSTRREESPGHNPDKSDAIVHARATSTGQLHALIEQLEQICRVVHPAENNLQAFGHEIRNVLILACTEVEAHWKNILKANGRDGKGTKDYVKLSLPLKLGEYCVELPYYPWLDAIRPFEKWVLSDCPSKALPWYAAYNNTKHDRERNFSEATLLHAFQAVTGCFVMLCAQHGWDFALKGDAASRAFFRLIKVPIWTPADLYVPAFGGELKPKQYQFEQLNTLEICSDK